MLDPLALTIHTKHQLGSDFVADFVVRRLNDEYVFVEIERSTHKVFTKAGEFTAPVNHAIRQVLDWQMWVAEYPNLARKKLPGLRNPDGLVVIGRRDSSDEFAAKLDRENFSRKASVKVLTYDDLLERAIILRDNVLAGPSVIGGRVQRGS